MSHKKKLPKPETYPCTKVGTGHLRETHVLGWPPCLHGPTAGSQQGTILVDGAGLPNRSHRPVAARSGRAVVFQRKSIPSASARNPVNFCPVLEGNETRPSRKVFALYQPGWCCATNNGMKGSVHLLHQRFRKSKKPSQFQSTPKPCPNPRLQRLLGPCLGAHRTRARSRAT